MTAQIPKVQIILVSNVMPEPLRRNYKDNSVVASKSIGPRSLVEMEKKGGLEKYQNKDGTYNELELSLRELSIFQESFPMMQYTVLKPVRHEDGSIEYPTRASFLEKVQEVAASSLNTFYFGMYYSGMSLAENGDLVFPKQAKFHPEQEIDVKADWREDFDKVNLDDIVK